ncbi:hypothetical protein N8993_11620 [Pseudomonadales bacterium]|nr:hypothetical protein [Pseudomonadales bacterium]
MNQVLLDLLIKAEADTFVCWNGVEGRQGDELRKGQGNQARHNSFDHPKYRQLRTAAFMHS